MKRILAVFVAAVFFLGSSFSFASTEMLLSDKALYLMIEKHNAEKLLQTFEELENIDFVKFLGSETSLKFETNLQIDCSEEEFIKRDIKILSEVNEDETYQRAEIKMYNNDKYIASLEMMLDETVLSLRLPELYEKYVTVDLEKLPDLCKKFGMPEEQLKEIIDEYKAQEELEAAMVLSEEQEKDFMNCIMRCGLLLNSLIKDEYFVLDNNAVISYENNVLPCRSISLEIPQRDLIHIIKTLWNEIRNDEKVMKICEEKLNLFYEYYKAELKESQEAYGTAEDMSLLYEENEPELPTLEEILTEVDEIFTTLEERFGPAYNDGRIVSKIYFEEDYDIIKREFGVKNESTAYNATMGLITLGNYYALEGDGFLLEDRIVENGNLTTHNFKYEYLDYDYDWDENWNLIKTEKWETKEFAIDVEKLAEQAYLISMNLDESSRLELTLSTKKLSKNSAVLNLDIRVLEKAEQNLQSVMPQKDLEVVGKLSMTVTQKHKIVKKNLRNKEINLNTMSLEALEKEWKKNESKIQERGEKLIKELFPEVVTMVEAMQERQRQNIESTNQAIEALSSEMNYSIE